MTPIDRIAERLDISGEAVVLVGDDSLEHPHAILEHLHLVLGRGVARRQRCALLGAFLTGLGCSMVFPSMGLVAVKVVPPQLRATAIGGFAAFQDLAYGATGPVLGVLADHAGYSPVFLIGGVAATVGIGMAIRT